MKSLKNETRENIGVWLVIKYIISKKEWPDNEEI